LYPLGLRQKHLSAEGLTGCTCNHWTFDLKQEKNIRLDLAESFKVSLTLGEDKVSRMKQGTEFG